MESNYYIYCIAQGEDNAVRYLKGFDGREIVLLPHIDIYAVISPSDRTHYDITLENLKCHEDVINNLMGAAVVLPMRFSTIVKSLDDVKKVLEKYYSKFKENIESVRDKVEMGMKIFCNINFSVQEEPETGMSGKEFFLKKYNNYIETKNKLEPYLNTAREIHNRLLVLSSENCCTNPLKNNLIMNASYLVPYENIEEFRKISDGFKDKYTGFKIIPSGPWPPYHFVKVEEGD